MGGTVAGGLTRRCGEWTNRTIASTVGCLCSLLGLLGIGSVLGIWMTELRGSDVVAVHFAQAFVQGIIFLPAYILSGMRREQPSDCSTIVRTSHGRTTPDTTTG